MVEVGNRSLPSLLWEMADNRIPKHRLLPLGAFFALFVIGTAILGWSEIKSAEREREGPHPPHDWRVVGIPWLQHLASALIVASVMGVTYEHFVHKHVVNDFDALLQEHEKATEQAFLAFQATTTRDVFNLLGSIAARSDRLPTLFEPPRSELTEVVFETDEDFFRRLIATDRARREAIEVISGWIESPSLALRFLGSDFIGLLYLQELMPRLRQLAAERQKHWKDAKEPERGCILNYWWAVSRFDDPQYESLKKRLINWNESFVQRWILFVAEQMPDNTLAHMVSLFLRVRGQGADKPAIEATISAIDALHHSGFDMRRAVMRPAAQEVFAKHSLTTEAALAVAAVPADRGSQSVLKRAWRRFTDWFN